MPAARVLKPVCVGEIVAAHGVRGQVKLRSFMVNPADIARHGMLCDAQGQPRFALSLEGSAQNDMLRARIKGVASREAAEALKGEKLYLPRTVLPEPQGEDFYHADLIGLAARLSDGHALGEVVTVHNYGAGDSLEIRRPDGKSLVVPFTRKAVPEVHLAEGWLMVELPPSLAADLAAKPAKKARHRGKPAAKEQKGPA